MQAQEQGRKTLCTARVRTGGDRDGGASRSGV